MYAAGVMLIAWNGSEICTLLGKDQYNTYSDFGGKADLLDGGIPYLTAAREMYEETLGIFYTQYEIAHMIYNGPYIQSKSYTNKPYYMYILWIDYNVLYNLDFNTAFNYISTIPGMNHQYKEKKVITWFKLDDIMNSACKIPLRNVFYKTIQNNKYRIKEIALELKARNIKNI
jgi:hypothetical protein